MKRIFFICLLLWAYWNTTAQVGINTTDPAATLDVNGNIRVRSLASTSTMATGGNAVQIVGLDAQGNMVPVTITDNVELINNELKSVEPTIRPVATPTPIVVPGNNRLDDLALGIWPGEANEKSQVIPMIFAGAGIQNVNITGIDATNAVDGRIIFLFASDGDIDLKTENNNSSPANRIMDAEDTKVERGGIVSLIYLTSVNRWVIMNAGFKHPD